MARCCQGLGWCSSKKQQAKQKKVVKKANCTANTSMGDDKDGDGLVDEQEFQQMVRANLHAHLSQSHRVADKMYTDRS